MIVHRIDRCQEHGDRTEILGPASRMENEPGNADSTGMAMKEPAARPRRRGEAKIYFRAKLIEAATEAIARHGFSGVSVSRLVEYSGLARGMVNLHFHRKDKLL